MNEPGVERATRWLHLAPIFLGLGCNAILGIDSGHPKANDGGDDASLSTDASTKESDVADSTLTDAAVDGSATDATSPCAAPWPSQPDVDDDPMHSGPALELAVETIQVRDDPGTELGLDLDGRCSCPEVATCLLGGKPRKKSCLEAPGGRDIVGNFLWAQFAAAETAFTQESLQARLDAGAAGTLFRITNYNGRANDQAVTIELFGKAWMPGPDGGPQPKPKRDGTDEWTVYDDTVGFAGAAPGTPLEAIQRDVLAYVNDYTLVAHFQDGTIALRPDTGTNNNPLAVEFHDAYLRAKLVPTERGFRLESAELAGRWPSDRMLKSFGALADVGGSICGNNGTYLSLKIGVCGALDMPGKQADDANSQSPCNAISFGLGFTAGPAHIGTTSESPVIEPGNCGDDWMPTCD